MKRILFSCGAVYVIVAFILTRLPLFNYLGYEFSVSIALFVPWIAGLTTIIMLRKAFNSTVPTTGLFLGTVLSSIRSQFLFLLLPLLIISLNAVFIKNCSYLEGLIFYLIIPVVTVVFSCSLGGFCFVLWRRALLMFCFLNVLILFYPMYIGWITPQIYSYNFIYGFFPGFSYDEVIELSGRLILFRIVTLIVSIFIISAGMFFLNYGIPGAPWIDRLKSLRHLLRFRVESLGLLFLGGALLLFWLTRSQLGFESPLSAIHAKLSIVMRTDHFRIHYSPGSFSESEEKRLAAEHEYRYGRIAEAMKVSSTAPIDSYIYPDAETKRLFIGTGTTNIAKPWRREIHLNKDSWEATLGHELVHAMAGEFGMPIIRANIHMGLVEGLAMAIDDDAGNRTLHEYAAAMMQFKLIRDPGKLISPAGFMFHASSVSYVLMGSFCKFLIGRYGVLRFKQIYGGKSPLMVYNASYDQLIDQWQQYLDRIEVPENWRSHVGFFFNRPSIFAKECARAVAKLNESGWKAFQERSAIKAMDLFSISLQKSWNTEAFNGLIRSSYRAEKFDTIISLISERRSDSVSISNLLLYYGDALWYRKEPDSARVVFRKIASLDLSEQYNEAIAERLAVLDDAILRDVLPRYFVGKIEDVETDKFFDEVEKKSANPIVFYLRAKYLIRNNQYESAIREFQKIKASTGSTILDCEKEQWTATCNFLLKRYQASRIHLWQSLNYITNEASIQRVEDNLDRCDWYDGHFK